MADSLVTSLTTASTLDGTEVLYVSQGGADRKVTTAGLLGLIARTALTGAAASIDFTSIPATWEDLRVVLYARGDNAANTTNVLLRFNGDTAGNYDTEDFYANNTAVTADPAGIGATSAVVGTITAASATGGQAGVIELMIPSYARTTLRKVALCRFGRIIAPGTASGYRAGMVFANWRSTAAVTQVTLTPAAGNFDAGTICSLYGVRGT